MHFAVSSLPRGLPPAVAPLLPRPDSMALKAALESAASHPRTPDWFQSRAPGPEHCEHERGKQARVRKRNGLRQEANKAMVMEHGIKSASVSKVTKAVARIWA